MSKIIFLGDLHFKSDNIQEAELFSLKIENLCKNQKPDFIVIGGDLLHTHERLHTIPLNKVCELIDILRNISKVFILVGNHDMISERQFLNDNHWMNPLKKWENVIICEKVCKYEFNNNTYLFCPYVSPGRFEEALNTINDFDWKTSKLIFCHQESRCRFHVNGSPKFFVLVDEY